MADNSRGVVVTDGMIVEAIQAGDLERLTIWARQGVQVRSVWPLAIAARSGQLEVVRLLVRELGADVGQAYHGLLPLMLAARINNLALVQCLVELGADVNQAMRRGGPTPFTFAACLGKFAVVRCLVELGALLKSGLNGHYATMLYLLNEVGSNMDDVDGVGGIVWNLLIVHLEEAHRKGEVENGLAALTGLLRVLVLRNAPPPALVTLLSPEPARVVQEGARLRARLPAYLAHRRAYLDLRCPRISVLPGVLRALIYIFEGPVTTEELWATGLGTAP
jgi:hypothetical protein